VSCGIIPEVVEQRDGRMARLEDNKEPRMMRGFFIQDERCVISATQPWQSRRP
jgi:hypothetical protein